MAGFVTTLTTNALLVFVRAHSFLSDCPLMTDYSIRLELVKQCSGGGQDARMKSDDLPRCDGLLDHLLGASLVARTYVICVVFSAMFIMIATISTRAVAPLCTSRSSS